MSNDTVVVEPGSDPRVAVIVFSGAMGQWGAGRHDFAHATQRMNYSRILCRDPYTVWYHEGIDDEHPDIDSSADFLRKQVRALKPKVLLVLGNSLGGYAALLFGHLISADAVHAFAPQTCLEPEYVRKHRPLDTPAKVNAYDRLWSSPAAMPKYFDLEAVLSKHNGRTTYHVHYCRENDADRAAAEWIAGKRGVKLFGYDCDGHMVARHIVRERLLFKILRPDFDGAGADRSSMEKIE